MTLGLWRHYCAFTIIFIQIIKLSFYWLENIYARGCFAQIKKKKVKRPYWSLWSLSGFLLIELQENLVSNIVSVICTSNQGINQTGSGESFLNVHYFSY